MIHQPYGDVYGSWRHGGTLPGRPDSRHWRQQLSPDRVMDLIVHNQVTPAVNQIETHPFCQQIETAFLAENGVQIESWGPLPKAATTCSENAAAFGLRTATTRA